MPTLRAVLFDSGGVLIRPIGGRWNPRADFEEILLEHYPNLTSAELAGAIAVGDAFLAGVSMTPAYDAFHTVMLEHLGIPPTPQLLAELSRPVPPARVVETYPEVLLTLRGLRDRGVRMAVVSDAWADLPAMHEALGMAGFFEAYAISELLGCFKPDPRMYAYASDALGLSPSECLFVDDDPELVAAAVKLGYEGRAVCRDATNEVADVRLASFAEVSGVASITGVDEILPLFARGTHA
jgi:FMN phosphatase YigB (HAD superfamily)